MLNEIKHYIRINELSPFTEAVMNNTKKSSIFKTAEGKKIHNKVLNFISSNFYFKDTKKILEYYFFTDDPKIIKQRQELFNFKNSFKDSEWLKTLKLSKDSWKPSYSIIVVTEDEETYMKLKKNKIPAELFYSTSQIEDLKYYDIVQVLDCEKYGFQLERIPQSIFLNSIEDVYIERYLEQLSLYLNILENITEKPTVLAINPDLNKKTKLFLELKPLMQKVCSKIISKEDVESKLIVMNQQLADKLSSITLSGTSLLQALGNKFDTQIVTLINSIICSSGYSSNIFKSNIPIEIDYDELEQEIKKNGTEVYTSLSDKIYKNKDIIKNIPQYLKDLEQTLVLLDFIQGICKNYRDEYKFPSFSENIKINNSKNLFIENPTPISFLLNEENKCSFLTGANSGGKTTLLEHILQIISLTQLGFPLYGDVSMPLFTDVYYYAKNKGSMNKGAFETLLTQMSSMVPGKSTLILADELEAVTEPGIAGHIITKTADFFIKKGCYMIFATHLGQEIKDKIPNFSRIDGIEAKGLDEKFNLIVNHNPIIGKIANSTPELIIQRLAQTKDNDYFKFLNKALT